MQQRYFILQSNVILWGIVYEILGYNLILVLQRFLLYHHLSTKSYLQQMYFILHASRYVTLLFYE